MVRIRALGTPDIPAADGVLCAAFASQESFAPRLRRYLAIQPDGWLVAEAQGAIVGMVGAINYGSFAYVGMMGVHPDRQGQGVGGSLLGTLLEQLDRRGVSCARLEATDQGRPLYLRHGFTDAGVSHEFRRVGAAPAPVTDWNGIQVASDPAEIIALDRLLFRADRPRLWQWLFAEEPGPILVARERGQASGYLCVQADTLGPWGARRPAIATALLRAAAPLIRSPRTRVMMPEENSAGRAVLEAQSWALQKVVPHMSRGPCPRQPGWGAIYGKGSYCLG
jgi:GNAT superfamily N-acetyltransferase